MCGWLHTCDILGGEVVGLDPAAGELLGGGLSHILQGVDRLQRHEVFAIGHGVVEGICCCCPSSSKVESHFLLVLKILTYPYYFIY